MWAGRQKADTNLVLLDMIRDGWVEVTILGGDKIAHLRACMPAGKQA